MNNESGNEKQVLGFSVADPENVYNLIQHIYENGFRETVFVSGYADPASIAGELELKEAVADYREASRNLVAVLRFLVCWSCVVSDGYATLQI